MPLIISPNDNFQEKGLEGVGMQSGGKPAEKSYNPSSFLRNGVKAFAAR